MSTIRIARTAVIAALYVALSLAVFPIASGAIQIRISEALCLLPLFFPEAIIGVTIGCVLTNLITGCVVYDIILGSVITLVAAVLTYFTGKLLKSTWLKITVGGIFPCILNALFLPLIWILCYGALEYVYIIQVLLILAGEVASVYVVGTPLVLFINRMRKQGIKVFC